MRSLKLLLLSMVIFKPLFIQATVYLFNANDFPITLYIAEAAVEEKIIKALNKEVEWKGIKKEFLQDGHLVMEVQPNVVAPIPSAGAFSIQCDLQKTLSDTLGSSFIIPYAALIEKPNMDIVYGVEIEPKDVATQALEETTDVIKADKYGNCLKLYSLLNFPCRIREKFVAVYKAYINFYKTPQQ